jgi:DNA-binding NarL/FixJ family response regulator
VRHAHAQIIEAADGQTAIELCREAVPDVLILDLNMPGTTGYDVLETLRREGIETTVIVLSADTQASAAERALALGVAAFVSKPLSPRQANRIIEQLRQKGGAASSHPLPTMRTPDRADALAEVVNIAMGRTALDFNRLFDTDVRMSPPQVAPLSEIFHALGSEQS